MHSSELARYKTIQSFWQNMGISYRDIDELTMYEYDMFQNIMNIETQFAEKESRKQSKKASKHGR